MKTLTFYGASDDNFCYAVNGKDKDEISCYEKPAIWKVYDPDEDLGLLIVGQYSIDGPFMPSCWTVGICQLDEDKQVPAWPLEYNCNAYSVTVTLTVPDVALVTQFYPVAEDA